MEAASPGLGGGSEITLRLPLASGVEEGAMAEQRAPGGSERSRRCLIVEDHEDAALIATVASLAGRRTAA